MIARRPKKEFTLDEVIEALKVIAPIVETQTQKIDGKEEKTEVVFKIDVDQFKTNCMTAGKQTGDDLRDDEID